MTPITPSEPDLSQTYDRLEPALQPDSPSVVPRCPSPLHPELEDEDIAESFLQSLEDGKEKGTAQVDVLLAWEGVRGNIQC